MAAGSSTLGEFDIIARYFAHHDRRAGVLLGVGDDAAVLEPRGDRHLVIAMDTIVEAVHFPTGTDAADIGYRALAVNLSDLAAMGAEPAWMTLSLSLPDADESWLQGFAAGLFELANEFDVALVGGDTVRGPRVITVQIAGWVEKDRWLTRSGARPGDLLFVSGTPGEAAAGLRVVQQESGSGASAMHLRQRFLRPSPRIGLGRQLRTIASAAMDVSDGLLTDLQKLCAASGCGARLDIDALPRSPQMRELFGPQACDDYALAGGDDYELLFTVPRERSALASRLSAGVSLTQIGVIVEGAGVQCLSEGKPYLPARAGYDHFAASRT
jgi:thiamine-monophosphate kinase